MKVAGACLKAARRAFCGEVSLCSSACGGVAGERGGATNSGTSPSWLMRALRFRGDTTRSSLCNIARAFARKSAASRVSGRHASAPSQRVVSGGGGKVIPLRAPPPPVSNYSDIKYWDTRYAELKVLSWSCLCLCVHRLWPTIAFTGGGDVRLVSELGVRVCPLQHYL